MLASLIASLASGETLIAVRRARRAAIAYFLAALATLCGFGFFVAALYIWAAQRYGLIEAALWMGGGFIVLALIILIGHRVTAGAQARRAADRRKADLTAVGVATALAVLPGLFRVRGGLGVLLAPAIGLVAYAIYRENSKPGPTDPDRPTD
jgi:undecaprenyl pyrophosphate phosphatase UppP